MTAWLRRAAAGLVLALAASASAASTYVPLINAGFESTKPGMFGNPEGWLSIQHAGDLSYTFRLDEIVRHDGARSVRIDNVGPEPFGSIYQQISAAAYRGKRLRFSAWLRTESARGSATGGGGVLILQAMQSGAPLAWNHMKDTAVAGSTDWKRYQVELEIPATADQIEVGAMLHGPGKLWLDDAQLQAVP